MAFLRLIRFQGRKSFSVILFWIVGAPFLVAGNVTPNPVRAELTNRNYSPSNSSVIHPSQNHSLAVSVIRLHATDPENRTSDDKESVSVREPKSLQINLPKIIGVDEGNTQNPEDLIRKALINHTFEHGGEEDLDKLVFSTLPEGSKLILRTVRIIRTDEDGEPMDDAEDTQPTYWDVTLANATDTILDNEEEAEAEADESEEESSEEDEKQSNDTVGHIKKKPDLDSSGSHSSANYHHLNNHGGSGREKEVGKAHYHGNTHGTTHKKTHTDTKGKNVKPYHGTEKGLTDYANDEDKSHKNEGERYKSSKRKNKGRKVSGFKRIYHKEEFQRTEHFFDDEEANRIAESFGLSEAKDHSNQGTKGDKRKYHGVRTEHLDGKKLKNEYGTRDGYDKGQHTSYKDHEKHNQHNNYGKSMSQSHGTPHESYHPHNNGHTDYHPNHNYHGSYSNSNPRQSALKVPTSVADHIIGNGDTYRGTIVSAPMATSFTVTEYATMAESSSTPDPSVVSVLTQAIQRFPMPRFAHGNFSDAIQRFNRTMHNPSGRKSGRKEQREKKMFFSPKYRPVKEEESPPIPITTVRIPVRTFKPVTSANAVPYQVTPRGNEEESEEEGEEEEESEEQQRGTPYAPNFRPRKRPQRPVQQPPPQGYSRQPPQGPRKPPPGPGPWRFPRRHKRPPRPGPLRPQSAPMAQDESGEYPQQMHMSNEPLAISLRHSSAYNRLGHRSRQPEQEQELPQMDLASFHDISTRKSDIVENDYVRNETEAENNDEAHFFNHEQRYAKHHLTSTLSPTGNNNKGGVRNTLMDPAPGVYSTIIKVLPATMLNVSETGNAQRENGYGQHPNNALTASGNIVSVTRRPKTHADIVSITTQFPQHYPQQQQQNQQHRPFLPKNRWLTLSLNLGNPDFKQGSEFGPAQHPFPRQSKKMSHIMRGIKNGLLKPFGRGPFFPHHALVAAPSVTGPAFHVYGKGPHNNMNMPPPHNMPHHRPRPYHIRHLHHHQQLRHPHSFPTSYNNNGGYNNHNRPMGGIGIASQSSLQQPHTVPAPPPPPNNNQRPKFYYKPSSVTNNNNSTTDSNTNSESRNNNVQGNGIPAPTSTATSITSTVSVTSTSSSSSSPPPPPPEQKARRQPPTPPFMNGLMDSVSGFFGKMG